MLTTNSANTPKPPYYAVIFTSLRTNVEDGYEATNDYLFKIIENEVGFLGIESARDLNGLGITVSYWKDLEAIKTWKEQSAHAKAQDGGRKHWYSHYKVRICLVEREYAFDKH